MYEEGGRKDLVKRETQELEIINSYLPEAYNEKELEDIIDQAIKDAKAESVGGIGKVMGLVMPWIKERAEGKQVQELVKNKLS